MKTKVNENQACPNCQSPLPAGALAGLCPACLIAQGFETQTGGPKNARFEPMPIEQVSKLFPQLEILSLLGAGGMGAVYKARQPALDRQVALKLLPPNDPTNGGNFEDRFNREARALARLSHPNIVAVHEFGETNGHHYFIMEFVDGANLRQLERSSQLSPREALQIIPQICDALQYAHDEGVVHRDIKPENVLVDRKGRVKIADFGLAKILGQDTESLRLTAEGQVMGTPHYMAPEQLEHPLSVDHRADIYSLGVVFYELLTGDLPLGNFAPPSSKVRVDVRFDEVVLRALENDLPIQLGASGNMSASAHGAGEKTSGLGWITTTMSPGEGDAIPTNINVRLDYAIGPLERSKKVPSNFRGGMSLESNGMLNGVGQDSEGNAFIAITVDTASLGSRQFGARAIATDGQELRPYSVGSSGIVDGPFRLFRFEFTLPLSDVEHFIIGTRSVLTIQWKDVILPPFNP